MSLTYAPLPLWSDLAHAILKTALSEDRLAAPWLRKGDRGFWFSRSAWSLLTIAQWRQKATGHKSLVVWLPDFFCNESLFPLRSLGAKLFFYPVNEEMAPDLDSCHMMEKKVPPDLFVLAHFFGQPVKGDEVAVFCRDTGAWLVEDAAHVLLPTQGIGQHGDFVIYSPHKHLPIPDGAVLVVRQNGSAQLGNCAQVLRDYRQIYHFSVGKSGFSHKHSNRWLLKRVLQKLGVRARKRSKICFEVKPDTRSLSLRHPRMSFLASSLLSSMLQHIESVAHIRLQNRLLWIQTLSEAGILKSIDPLAVTATPYLAGFCFKNSTFAGDIFMKWHQAGLPVTTWPDLPPEVLNNPDEHRNAIKFRTSRIYLPVHQTLDSRHIVRSVQFFQE